MPAPAALDKLIRLAGEAVCDCMTGYPPDAASLARQMDRAVDWDRMPAPARALVERLDDALWEMAAEVILRAGEHARLIVLEGLKREARDIVAREAADRA